MQMWKWTKTGRAANLGGGGDHMTVHLPKSIELCQCPILSLAGSLHLALRVIVHLKLLFVHVSKNGDGVNLFKVHWLHL
jgi:hypothetical protein